MHFVKPSNIRIYDMLFLLQVLSALDILRPGQFYQELYVVTELMQSDLHKIIVSPQPLSADHVKCFVYQILRGKCYARF